jgi:hypothetical protein
MYDLEVAKYILNIRNCTLVIVKNRELIYESNRSGITSLLESIEKFSEELFGSSLADRVVGRAASLLIVYSHIKNVYAYVISKEGLRTLIENNVHTEFKNYVPKILNREGNDVCPYEEFSYSIESIQEAYTKLKQFSQIISNGQT